MATSATDVNNTAPVVQQMDFDMSPYLDAIRQQSEANSAWNAEQSALQRDWTARQTQLTMQYNAAEAAKNRDWQEYMSNTAHQREVADLRAAGLNPVLSASGGNGAAVSSGATASAHSGNGSEAQADTSANSAIVGLLSAMLSRQTQLYQADLNARTQEALADKTNATNELIAMLYTNASRYGADRSAAASAYAAQQAAMANMYGSNVMSEAYRYGYEKSYEAQIYAANQHYEGVKYQVNYQKPNSVWSALYPILENAGLGSEYFGQSVGYLKSAFERWYGYTTNLPNNVKEIAAKFAAYLQSQNTASHYEH